MGRAAVTDPYQNGDRAGHWPTSRPTAAPSRMCTENGGRGPAGRVRISACGKSASWWGVSDAAIDCNKITLLSDVQARFRLPLYDHRSESRPTGGRITFTWCAAGLSFVQLSNRGAEAPREAFKARPHFPSLIRRVVQWPSERRASGAAVSAPTRPTGRNGRSPGARGASSLATARKTARVLTKTRRKRRSARRRRALAVHVRTRQTSWPARRCSRSRPWRPRARRAPPLLRRGLLLALPRSPLLPLHQARRARRSFTQQRPSTAWP